MNRVNFDNVVVRVCMKVSNPNQLIFYSEKMFPSAIDGPVSFR